ncbi:hypothetical protein Z517_10559 [Fonsecaea pedrosoi CBS 271.37]|uniref:Uncharacterized protein n=1 Tax=Fonsecaea pedrosoi CBS 271.37 TaxID=1442368 RepID=A0A0D2GAF2_9EURO|nr:uncharacterized protein Z517_10559 [Fonsecaea pedrosoi CBS 271.37]KIW75815.1 hypothetical protein Z517_10559 [Fonsecaea pedrosoi CBS 271.37]
MKIARTIIQPIRSLTAVPFKGIQPSLRRQIKELNRSRCHFTRVKLIEPFSNTQPIPPSRTLRKRRHLTPERFEKQYESLDHLVPLDNDHSRFLSDLAEPGLFLEKDFDAVQEDEEAQRRPTEVVCLEMEDTDVVMTDYEEMEDVEMRDALHPPRLVYWQGEYPPPEFFFPFPPPYAGIDILQQEIKTEEVCSTVSCDQVAQGSPVEPSHVKPEPLTKDPVVEYFENLEYNIANGILPPNIAAEATSPANPPAEKLGDEKVGAEQVSPEKDSIPEGKERESEPEAAKVGDPVESRVRRKTVSFEHVPIQYHGLVEEAIDFSVDQMRPPPEWWKSTTLKGNDGDKGHGKCVIRSFEQYAAWPPHLQVQPQFHCPDPQNPKGEFNTPASCRLGLKRNREERKRFSEIRKNHPEVWEAIIGTMLQEGVSIDSMLLCHEAQDEKGNTIDLRPQVLDNQKWCVDEWRFDNLSWHSMQDAALPLDCSQEFHKAPTGDERVFQETIAYLKVHPEICYVFRILVSEWLKVEANQVAFRGVARKAGWCPAAEHQLQREFIEWVFANASGTAKEIFSLVEKHFSNRYPRFFAAAIKEKEKTASS